MSFAPRKRWRGLADFHIVHPHRNHGGQHIPNFGYVRKVNEGLFDVEIENLVYVFTPPPDKQGFVVKTLAFADRTGDPNIGQKVHFQPIAAIALASFTATPRPIKTESARFPTADFGFGGNRKKFANLVKYLDVGSRIGTRSPPNRGLVDGNDLVDMISAIKSVMNANPA